MEAQGSSGAVELGLESGLVRTFSFGSAGGLECPASVAETAPPHGGREAPRRPGTLCFGAPRLPKRCQLPPPPRLAAPEGADDGGGLAKFPPGPPPTSRPPATPDALMMAESEPPPLEQPPLEPPDATAPGTSTGQASEVGDLRLHQKAALDTVMETMPEDEATLQLAVEAPISASAAEEGSEGIVGASSATACVSSEQSTLEATCETQQHAMALETSSEDVQAAGRKKDETASLMLEPAKAVLCQHTRSKNSSPTASGATTAHTRPAFQPSRTLAQTSPIPRPPLQKGSTSHLNMPASCKNGGSSAGEWCRWARSIFVRSGDVTVSKASIKPNDKQPAVGRMARSARPKRAMEPHRLPVDRIKHNVAFEYYALPPRKTIDVSADRNQLKVGLSKIEKEATESRQRSSSVAEVFIGRQSRCLLELVLRAWSQQLENSALAEAEAEARQKCEEDHQRMEAAWEERLRELEEHRATLRNAEKQHLSVAKGHAHNVAIAITGSHCASLLASTLHAWARLVERSRLQRECEQQLQKVEEEQRRALAEVKVQKASGMCSWAKKVACTMMSSRLQETLIIVVSSWMRAARCQRHQRDLDLSQAAHRREVDAQKEELQQEHRLLYQAEADCERLQCEIQRCEQEVSSLQEKCSTSLVAMQKPVAHSTLEDDALSLCCPNDCRTTSNNVQCGLDKLGDRRRYDLMLLIPGLQQAAYRRNIKAQNASSLPDDCQLDNRTSGGTSAGSGDQSDSSMASSSGGLSAPSSPASCADSVQAPTPDFAVVPDYSQFEVPAPPPAARFALATVDPMLGAGAGDVGEHRANSSAELRPRRRPRANTGPQGVCIAELESVSEPPPHQRRRRRWSQPGRRRSKQATVVAPEAVAPEAVARAPAACRRTPRRRSAPAVARRPESVVACMPAPWEDDAFSFDAGYGSN